MSSASPYLPATTVAQTLHDRIDFGLKHFCQFRAVLVDSGCFTVVQPRVVEHEPHVFHVLPRLLVLTRIQLALDGRQVNGVLHYVKVVLQEQKQVRSHSTIEQKTLNNVRVITFE